MSEPIDVPALPRPWSDGRARAFDAALTSLLLLPVLAFPFSSVDRSTTLLSFVQIVPLVLRRVQPVGCFFTVTAAMALQLALLDAPIWGQVAMPVAIYAVAAYEDKGTARACLVAGVIAGIVGPVDWVVGEGLSSQQLFLWFSTTLLMIIAPWAVGSLIKAQRAYAAEVVARSQQLEREAALKADLAAAEERARVAREMHDVVAHGLSVMIVQADGARYSVTSQPEEAAHALESIADTGRDCLAETRRMLGLLATEGGGEPEAAQPGLDDVRSLVEHAQESGLRVTADIAHPLPVVSAGIGLTVYRITQEALSNVRKHAGPSADVHVSLRMIGNDLVIEILDDGRGADAGLEEMEGPGRGLAGMRERVSMHGGHLEAGPRPGGGFAVRARLPLLFREPYV
ncbi:MAG TPA: histidine kinase [Nocardioidaceae bacterium]